VIRTFVLSIASKNRASAASCSRCHTTQVTVGAVLPTKHRVLGAISSFLTAMPLWGEQWVTLRMHSRNLRLPGSEFMRLRDIRAVEPSESFIPARPVSLLPQPGLCKSMRWLHACAVLALALACFQGAGAANRPEAWTMNDVETMAGSRLGDWSASETAQFLVRSEAVSPAVAAIFES
jgi:hypothetical protein